LPDEVRLLDEAACSTAGYVRLVRAATTLFLLASCSFSAKASGDAMTGEDAPSAIDGPAADASLACTAPPAGLIAWWPGDNVAEIIGNRTGVLRNGAMAGTAGKVGGAFDFDGIDDRLDVVTDLPPLTVFTIEGWVNFGTATSSWRTIFANDAIGPGFWMKDRRICWLQANVDRFISNVTIPAGTWHHFALVHGTDQILRGYVDGVAAGTVQYQAAFIPGGATIGGYGGYELDGQIDELSIYDQALSVTEIGAIVAAGANGKCR
jgi:hypothetical protein